MEQLEPTMSLGQKEIDLIQKLSEYGAAVEQAGKDYSPSGIANYCYELTKQFNQFYHDFSILGADTAEEQQVRLVLAANVAKLIRQGMRLLGIEVGEAHPSGHAPARHRGTRENVNSFPSSSMLSMLRCHRNTIATPNSHHFQCHFKTLPPTVTTRFCRFLWKCVPMHGPWMPPAQETQE